MERATTGGRCWQAASVPNAETNVYTDGACSGNPGPGGWAWAVDSGDPSNPAATGSGGEDQTTNQRMELAAVLDALRRLDGPVTVHSDSTYVVNCFNDRWYEGWLKRGWRNANRKPVANQDLWEPLVELFRTRRDELTFVWVKGHSGDPMNDLVDAMAVAETEARGGGSARAGSSAGTDSTPGEDRGAADGPQPPWPIERAVAVTGVKELDEDQIEALAEVMAGLDPGHDVVVSGLRRGAELDGAEAALAHHLPLGVVLPFEDPASGWPPAQRRRFDACVEAAEWTVVLDGDRRRPQKAVGRRDLWIWSAVVGAVIVGDGARIDEVEALGLGVIEI